jgi:aminoglycoside 3-N-acetyltransferase I
VSESHTEAGANDAVEFRRLGPTDVEAARAAFAMMHRVFEAEPAELSDRYLADLLTSGSFWAIGAFEADEPVGCITAHELPMTRSERTELFIYDLAVRADRQRRGIARRLVDTLVSDAAERGTDVVFVAADDEDDHALAFYADLGGRPAPVTMFDLGAA